MLIEQPVTIDLTVGAERRIVDTPDTTVTVPPVVAPVLLTARPTSLRTQPSNFNLADSCAFQFFIARVNQAAITNSLLVLAKGLWELEMSMSSSFDYAAAPPLGTLSGIEIQLTNSFATIALLSRFPTIGAFVDFQRVRVLLIEPTTVNSFVPVTAAAQNLAQKINMNCIRII